MISDFSYISDIKDRKMKELKLKVEKLKSGFITKKLKVSIKNVID